MHVRGANGREDWGYGDWAEVMEMSRVGAWLGERVAIERGSIIIAVTDAAIQLSTPAQPSPVPLLLRGIRQTNKAADADADPVTPSPLPLLVPRSSDLLPTYSSRHLPVSPTHFHMTLSTPPANLYPPSPSPSNPTPPSRRTTHRAAPRRVRQHHHRLRPRRQRLQPVLTPRPPPKSQSASPPLGWRGKGSCLAPAAVRESLVRSHVSSWGR